MSNPLNNKANWMGGSDEPLTGFSWKSGGTRDTTGIILWSDVFLETNEIGENLAIILMDSQGLFDSKTSPADNSRIFALGTLISSVQIFNLNDVIQENQLQYLQLATDYAKLAAMDNRQSFEIKPFQKLLFLIRDWNYPDDQPYGFVGGNSYLKKNLKVENNQHESLKSVREYIFTSFQDITCCLLPHPGSSVTRSNYDGSWSKMDEDFKNELKTLIETLLDPKKLVIKKINNQELSAADLKNYIEVYFRVFQSNDIVGAQSLYELTVSEQMNLLIQAGLQTYKENLVKENITDIANIAEHLDSVHFKSKVIAVGQFEKAKKMGSMKHQLKFQKELENKIDETFKEWKVNAVENYAKFAAEVKITKEKEAENKLLKEEENKTIKDNEIKIRNIQQNYQNISDQEKVKYDEMVAKLDETKKKIVEQKKKFDEEPKPTAAAASNGGFSFSLSIGPFNSKNKDKKE